MKPIQFVRIIIAALVLTSVATAPSPAQVLVHIGINIGTPPPELPVYYQPVVPGPGYIWEPGYWAWGPYGYYWVPGTWVYPPDPGYLWTPGYWGWGGGYYSWHPGYWATSVGYYGGINYGFGYFGAGYDGGGWFGGVFRYNSFVTNVPRGASWAGGSRYVYVNNSVHNTYIYNNNSSHVSYNGGRGGVQARPTAGERAAGHLHHINATPQQMQHLQVAGQDHRLLATSNHGQPPVLTANRPLTTTRSLPNFTPVRPQDRSLQQYHTPVNNQSPIHRQISNPPMNHSPVQQFNRPASTYHAPVNQTPAYRQPVHQTPVYHQPVNQTPIYHAPVNHAPVNTQPAYRQPVYHQPTYRQPPAYHPPAYHPQVNHAPPQPANRPQPQHSHGPR